MDKQAISYRVQDLLEGIQTVGKLLLGGIVVIIGFFIFITTCCIAIGTFPLWIVLYVFTGYNIIDPCWDLCIWFVELGVRIID